MFGGSLSFRIDVAWVGVWDVLCCWTESGEFLCAGCLVCTFLWMIRLAVLRSFVSLLSCLLSEFVRGVCSFSGSGGGPGVAIGQIFLGEIVVCVKHSDDVLCCLVDLGVCCFVRVCEFGEVGGRAFVGRCCVSVAELI